MPMNGKRLRRESLWLQNVDILEQIIEGLTMVEGKTADPPNPCERCRLLYPDHRAELLHMASTIQDEHGVPISGHQAVLKNNKLLSNR
jgi:hypothetical protein